MKFNEHEAHIYIPLLILQTEYSLAQLHITEIDSHGMNEILANT